MLARSPVLLLGHLLAFSTCARPPAAPDSPPWSEAGRRAHARQAWQCVRQGTPPTGHGHAVTGGGGTVTGGGGTGPRVDTSCRYERFLCQQIHRGAQATEAEKAECSAYESVHGRVSAR